MRRFRQISYKELFGKLRNFLQSSEPVVLLALLIVVLAVWGFTTLAAKVIEGDTYAFDEWLLHVTRNPQNPMEPIGPLWLRNAARDLTALGSTFVLGLFLFLVIGFVWFTRRYALVWVLVASSFGGMIAMQLLKVIIGRPRPEVAGPLPSFYSTSFPSGHSMLSAIVYLTLGTLLAAVLTRKRLKAYVLGSALLLSGIVGITRVYLGVHYPTDVLAGWSAGLAWALLWGLVIRYLQKRGYVESVKITKSS